MILPGKDDEIDAQLMTKKKNGMGFFSLFVVDANSVQDAEVPPRGKALVSTGLSIAIPCGFYGRIAPRSGLAWKNSIDVGAGVIGKYASRVHFRANVFF